MDLGIAGKTALVSASSAGLGRACAEALASEGCDLVINGRDAARLQAAADELSRRHGVAVRAIACDTATVAGAAPLIEAAAGVDILVTNGGGPAPRDFRELGRGEILAAIEQNMLVPIALVQAAAAAMAARGFGRVVNVTSLAVLAPVAGLELSSAARAGLTAFVAGVAQSVAGAGVTINNLLPFKFDTDRIATTLGYAAKMRGVSFEEERQRQMSAIPAGRFDRPEEFGRICAFLSSVHAGYVTGQNIVLDGGSHRATF